MKVDDAISFLTSQGYEIISPQSKVAISEEFEYWWHLYNKKRGKSQCIKKWTRMNSKDRKACIQATPAYVSSVSEKQFQKDPLTYLNGRCWEDEIIEQHGNDEQKTAISFAEKAARILSFD